VTISFRKIFWRTQRDRPYIALNLNMAMNDALQDSKMSFRFHKRIKIVPGPAVNLSKRWPSLAIGGQDASPNVSRRGPCGTSGMPGNGLSWQFGGPRHIHKAIQAQSDVKAVHAQGTAKAVEAQAYIIAITNRLETVAKRLTRNAPGSTSWKKAAIEQARLLDEMLEVAKEGENELLISAVRKCHDAWGNDDLHIRAALSSGMTVSECLTNMLAGRQADENVSVPLLSHPVPDTNNAGPSPCDEPVADQKRPTLGLKPIERSLHKTEIEPVLGERLARNLILLAIGGVVIAAVYTIAIRKPITRTQVTLMGSPTPGATTARLVPAPPIAAIVPETTAVAPPAPLATPAAAPAATSAATPAAETVVTPLDHGQDIQDKPARAKRSNHQTTRGHGQ
jgi:Protein of unknown function (DUF4236)